MKMGTLYFVQVDGGGPIKIGWTQGCVTNRMRQIQWASPYILNWIGACDAPRSHEKAAHQTLAAYRLRREWFHPTAPVLDFIQGRVGDFDPSAYVDRIFRLDLMRRYRVAGERRFARQDEILREIGIGRYWIAAWTERRKPLPSDVYDRLDAVLTRIEQEREAA